MRRNFTKWIIIILTLFSLLVVRIVKRTYTFKAKPFINKNLIQVEFKDLSSREVIIKKEKNEWMIFVSSKVLPSDKNIVNELVDDIKNFELVEVITKETQKYSDYLVNEDSATIVKVYFYKVKNPSVIYFGKTGGFSFNESYVRIDKNPQVYLAKGLNAFHFKKNFYELCDRTVFKDNNIEDEINYITIKQQNKTIQLKRELKDNTTYWVDIKSNSKIDVSKVNSFLLLFKNFIADLIVDENEIDLNKLTPILLQIALKYKEDASITLELYKEYKKNEIPIYPIKIRYSNLSSYTDASGKEDIIYGCYKYKYDDFSRRISDLK